MDTSLPQPALVLSQHFLRLCRRPLPLQCFLLRTLLPEDLTFLMLMLSSNSTLHLTQRPFPIVAVGQLELGGMGRHTHF
jgi:hypothetical protein